MSSWTKFIERICFQNAVYWEPSLNDGFGGITFSVPREIKVRWEDERELVETDGEQNEEGRVLSTARIICAENLKMNGYLYLGFLTDIPGDQTNPVGINQAFRIMDIRKVPLLNGNDVINEYIV